MKRRSPVWRYFDKTEDIKRQKCKLCSCTVSAGDSSTTNLFNHLKNHHPAQYAEIKPAKVQKKTVASSSCSSTPSSTTDPSPIAVAFKKSIPYEHNSNEWKKRTKAVTTYIAKEKRPFRTVEKSGFQSMLKAFDRRYDPPSKSQMSKVHIPALYTEVREKVVKDLGTMEYYSATADMWSSHGMTPYMGYTVHYIDEEWNLQTRTLGTKYVPENHTGDVIASAMTNTLDEWGLDPKKQVCITTDNGANIVKACRDLSWERLSCFGHNLHLGITKCLKDDARVRRALGVARGIVTTFSHSFPKRRDLTAAQVAKKRDERALVSVSATFYPINCWHNSVSTNKV